MNRGLSKKRVRQGAEPVCLTMVVHVQAAGYGALRDAVRLVRDHTDSCLEGVLISQLVAARGDDVSSALETIDQNLGTTISRQIQKATELHEGLCYLFSALTFEDNGETAYYGREIWYVRAPV
jgi:hypothetical protein